MFKNAFDCNLWRPSQMMGKLTCYLFISMCLSSPIMAGHEIKQTTVRSAATGQEECKNQYVAKIADDLYFVMEKIDSKNKFYTWKLFEAENQGTWFNQISPDKAAIAGGVSIAAGSFMPPLKNWQDMEAWVAYVTNVEPPKRGFYVFRAEALFRNKPPESKLEEESNNTQRLRFYKLASHIEMSVGVATSQQAHFQIHKGIFRNLKYMLDGNKEHKGLSAALHGFAAQFSLQHFGSKSYVMTTPMGTMAHILEKNLKKGTFAVNDQFKWSGGTPSINDHDMSYGVHQDFNFKLFDRNGQLLDHINRNSAHSESGYQWALSTIGMASHYPLFVIDMKELAGLWDKYDGSHQPPI
jgi:hypothetical protein